MAKCGYWNMNKFYYKVNLISNYEQVLLSVNYKMTIVVIGSLFLFRMLVFFQKNFLNFTFF